MEGELDRDRRIATLKKHPVWPDLSEHWHERHQQQIETIGRMALAGNLTDVQLHEYRGFWRGVFTVLETPAGKEELIKRREKQR